MLSDLGLATASDLRNRSAPFNNVPTLSKFRVVPVEEQPLRHKDLIGTVLVAPNCWVTGGFLSRLTQQIQCLLTVEAGSHPSLRP
jgi:hypothetical protein